jgi:hypothetical protein
MRLLAACVLIGVTLAGAARADDPSPEDKAAKLAALCTSSRTLRVTDAQKYTRAWVGRLAAIRGAGCHVVRRSLVQPSPDHLECGPKGTPDGETLETVYDALLLADPSAPPSSQPSPTDDSKAKDVDLTCKEADARAGLDLFPATNDAAALNRLLSWKK